MNNIDVKPLRNFWDTVPILSLFDDGYTILHISVSPDPERSFESFESFESSTLFGGNKTGWKAPRVQSASTMVLCQAGNASANGIGYGNCGSAFLNLDSSGFFANWKLEN